MVRAKAQLLAVLVVQLEALRQRSRATARGSKVFSPLCRQLSWLRRCREARAGTIVPMLWAELGDAKSRWESFRHLQAEAGGVPVTKASGKSRVVEFRFCL